MVTNMATKLTMPKLGLTMTEGIVAKWHKSEGDSVKPGEILYEVETDKLTNEVVADCEGVLLKIVAREGDSIPCTGLVGYVGEPDEKIMEDAKAVSEISAPEAKLQAAPALSASIQQTTVSNGGTILASPAAKRLAKENKIDLASLTASGPDGAIVLKDVEACVSGAPRRVSGLAAKIASELGIDANVLPGGERRVMGTDVLRTALSMDQCGEDTPIVFNSMRKTIARRMSESWSLSPRVCFEMAVDCSGVIALRAQLKKAFEAKGLNLTYNHIIMLAVARALCEYPNVNASLSDDTLLLHHEVNIGLAVGIENGLLVPNLKRCERMGLEMIAAGTEDMVRRAREGKLSMDELSGGTFTITNLGMYGMRSFSPIINQPELAILGVNAMVDTPVAVDGEVVVLPMMNLNLVADHRVVDGVLAAKFLHRIVELLEAPALMLM